MSDDAEKKLDLLLEKSVKMEQDLKEIKEYIPVTDIVTNAEYCRLRGMKKKTFDYWVVKPDCPRVDKHTVSVKAFDKFRSDSATRKKK
jgi:hypothetical protein